MAVISVEPEVLKWALERSDMDPTSEKYQQYQAYVQGTENPDFEDLRQFAADTRVPLGMLFLSEPPEHDLPIPDRCDVSSSTTGGGKKRKRRPKYSENLIDTLYDCALKQEWYREYSSENKLETFTPRWMQNGGSLALAA